MIAAARLHHLWQALPVGTLTDVIGSRVASFWRRIPMMKASAVAD